jgi:hypothetical protein
VLAFALRGALDGGCLYHRKSMKHTNAGLRRKKPMGELYADPTREVRLILHSIRMSPEPDCALMVTPPPFRVPEMWCLSMGVRMVIGRSDVTVPEPV